MSSSEAAQNLCSLRHLSLFYYLYTGFSYKLLNGNLGYYYRSLIMKIETKTVAEYRTPECEVLEIQVQKVVCTSPYGAMGTAGPDVPVENDTYGY